jgi:hypothetical protein
MVKVDEQDRPVLDKLMSSGTITSYGSSVSLIHQEGQPTHADWFTASTEGGILKTLDAFYKSPGSTDTKVQGDSKHWDYFLVCPVYNLHSGKQEGGYVTSVQWEVKPGQMHAYNELIKSSIAPVFDKLLADGSVTSYGSCTEDYHTGSMQRSAFYFTVPDADANDKASKALDEAFDKNPTLMDAVHNVVSDEGHRDALGQIRFISIK